MNQQDYNCSIAVNINAGQAFEGICNVAGWWAQDLEGAAQSLNDVFTIHFGQTFVTFKLTEVVPVNKIVWHVMDCYLHWLDDKTEWTGTKVVWEITAANNGTKIDMTHAGLIPEVECYNSCVKGWDFFVKQSLFKLLSEGRGMPDTAKNARAKVN